jgi:hypothetical protein
VIPLYGLSIFLSAALLFAVQPMFTKLVLPLLGGSPAVWNTTLVFFQVVLLLGYGYAHLGARFLGPRRQALLHLLLIPLAALLLPLALPAGSAPPTDRSPVPWLLLTLATRVGPPFFLLSATGPLLQRWFSATAHHQRRDPYFLYAASNLGSMLALLAYPTLIEPALRLRQQLSLWAALYAALALTLTGCAYFVARAPAKSAVVEATSPPDEAPAPSPTLARQARWVALAFVPSSLMMGLTTYLTADVASVPLLWVAPLAIYLLTFILAFLQRPLLPERLLASATPAFLAAAVAASAIPIYGPTWLLLTLGLGAFFFCALRCHGELARDRPPIRHLTSFYLLISLGGALGGAFCALIVPLIWSTAVEYGLTLVAGALLLPGRAATPGESLSALRRPGAERARDLVFPLFLGAASLAFFWLRARGGSLSTLAPGTLFAAFTLLALVSARRPLRFGLSLAALLLAGTFGQRSGEGVLLRERGFFGALRVSRTSAEAAWAPGRATAGDSAFHALYHGATLHGLQATSPPLRDLPLAYYSQGSPIGQVFLSGLLPADARVGIVGLGVGALLAYGEPGQSFLLYEIDPQVAAIAADPRYFTYLSSARAAHQIILGDARLSLSREQQRFDLLVLDAYSSDSVPVHLLTREALTLYLERLNPRGLIAFHLSNRHLDLFPVVAGVSRALGLTAMEQLAPASDADRAIGIMASRWALVARRPEDFGALGEDPRWKQADPGQSTLVWTDDYSSVVGVLR